MKTLKILMLNLCLILFACFALFAEPLKCNVCGQIYSTPKFNFCPADGAPLTTQKFMIVNIPDSKPTPAAAAAIQAQRNTAESARLVEEEYKTGIRESVKLNIYDFDKTMRIIKKYYDTDNYLTFYLLNYLYQKYPENIEVIKLYAEYYMRMNEYSRAAELLAKAEEILNKQIELIK